MARIQRSVKPVQITVTGKEVSSQEFGSSLDASYFKSDKVNAMIKQHGLYKFDLSVVDLRGTEKNPVKQGINEDLSYQGQFLGSMMHGKGHMLTKSGDLYICPFQDSYAHGTGAVYFANGNYYFGRLVQGDLDTGKMTYANGQVYVGEFRNGKRNGKGSLLYLDGSKYEGQFLDDLEHGEGKVVSEGIYEKGKKVHNKKMHLEATGKTDTYHVVAQPAPTQNNAAQNQSAPQAQKPIEGAKPEGTPVHTK